MRSVCLTLNCPMFLTWQVKVTSLVIGTDMFFSPSVKLGSRSRTPEFSPYHHSHCFFAHLAAAQSDSSVLRWWWAELSPEPGTERWRDSTSSASELSLSLSLHKRCLGTQEINRVWELMDSLLNAIINLRKYYPLVVLVLKLFTEYLDLISALECSEKNQI